MLASLLILVFTGTRALAWPLDFISIPLYPLHSPFGAADSLDLAVHRTHALNRLAHFTELSVPPRRQPTYTRSRRHRRAFLSGISQQENDTDDSDASDALSPAEDLTLDHGPHRQSDSEVTKAHRVQYENSSGLDIEGKDIGYLVEIPIGSEGKVFRLLVDSGSSDMWVGGEGCKSDAGGDCGDHQFLGRSCSSSFRQTQTPWSIRYGTGSVSGILARDDVVFPGNVRLRNHTFGVAQIESTEFTKNNIPLDGILGCGQQSLSVQQTPTFLNALYNAGLISRRIISYHISRIADGNNDGEITLGGMDPAKYDAKTLARLPNANNGGFWEATLDRIHVNGKDLGLRGRSCILDTGTVGCVASLTDMEADHPKTLFVAPESDVAAIHAMIPGAVLSNSSHWNIPCNTKAVVSLEFGQRMFPIQARDLVFGPTEDGSMCTSTIVKGGVARPSGTTRWLIGDVWLKNVWFSSDEDENMILIARGRE
ncbi:Aspartic peptidase A1 [Mycena kentingensis (nom. inval.)]|nr:Aspartic peptidase A1 [Mycena kentingensis (nom. inval.)]